jgi:hypothetical protein
MIAAGVLGAAVIRFGFSDYYEVALLSTFTMLALAMVIKPVSYVLFGIYQRLPSNNRLKDAFLIFLAVTSSSLILGVLMLGLSSLGIFKAFPRMMVFYDWILTVVFVIGSRFLIPNKFTEKGDQFPKKWLGWIRQDFQRIITDGLKYFSPGVMLMLVYLFWNQIYFGTPMPVSGQVKHWWSTLPNTVYGHPFNLKVFLSMSSSGNYGPWSLATNWLNRFVISLLSGNGFLNETNYWLVTIIFIGLIIFVLAALFHASRVDWKEKASRIGLHALVIGCLAQIAYYLATSYPNPRSWYWVGEMLCIVLFLAIVLEAFSHFLLRHRLKIQVILAIEFVLIAVLVLINYRYITSSTPWKISAGTEEEYLDDARGLEKLTPPGAIIGMTGGGTVAYWVQDRTIVNLDGLMNSIQYLHALQNNGGTEFLDRMGISYIDGSEYMVMESDPYRALLKDRLERIGTIRGLESFTLFKYLNPLLKEN